MEKELNGEDKDGKEEKGFKRPFNRQLWCNIITWLGRSQSTLCQHKYTCVLNAYCEIIDKHNPWTSLFRFPSFKNSGFIFITVELTISGPKLMHNSFLLCCLSQLFNIMVCCSWDNSLKNHTSCRDICIVIICWTAVWIFYFHLFRLRKRRKYYYYHYYQHCNYPNPKLGHRKTAHNL